ncbi:hypothetical protein EFE32_06745 [Lactococcus lactis subsp. lactis]|uniref:hypothetical protein n=1 Tax=Lactococcus lactis TaxID=1358 RepID=UPI00223BCE1C|nr:hypothetical protein [Lactococcus lactis]MCT0016542.1 hypothetical protein [Lactococcus lactis subsp. lactis]
MEYEFTCEIVEDCESYCEKLGNTSSLPIFIADDECSEIVNQVIDRKYIFEKKYSQRCIILYLDNKSSYFVALAIGKRLNLEICSVSSYSKTQKGYFSIFLNESKKKNIMQVAKEIDNDSKHRIK